MREQRALVALRITSGKVVAIGIGTLWLCSNVSSVDAQTAEQPAGSVQPATQAASDVPEPAAPAITQALPAQSGPIIQRQAVLDEFDTLSTEHWFISDGWVNGAHQNCLWSADRVAAVEGTLRISLTDTARDGQPFTCGEVQSNARFGYGTYEARMQVTYRAGANANFFTHVGAAQKEPHNEIDFEFISRSNPTLQTNFFTNDKGGHEELHPQPADDAFRNYGLIWQPGLLQWYVDGRLIREARGADVPSAAQKVYFSLWSSGTLTEWLGAFAYPGQPLELLVDRFAFTPMGADCAFDGSLACVGD